MDETGGGDSDKITSNRTTRNDRAREAHFELQTGLKKARELVAQTRFLLAGEAEQAGEDPAAQAAAETSETVQNPSGE